MDNQNNNQPSGANSLIDPNKLYSIGQAAQILGVSIDTLRRWEQKGTLKAVRTSGQLRRFSGQELINYQNESTNADALIPISKAAKELNVSIQTMRRWDKSGKLRSQRAPDGARMYRLKDIRDIAQGFTPESQQSQPQPQPSEQPKDNQNISKDIVEAIDTIAEQIDEHTEQAETITDTNDAVAAADEDKAIAEAQPVNPTEPEHPEEGSVDDDTAHDITMPPPQPIKDDVDLTPLLQPNIPPVAEQPVEVIAAEQAPVQPIPDRLTVAVTSEIGTKSAPEFDTLGNLVKPAIEDHGDNTAGMATLPAGSNKMVIKTRAVHKDSLIFITPQTPTVSPLTTPVSLDGEGFAVTVAIPQRYDVNFNWLIVEPVSPNL